jgi:dTDP-glucose pyrophosphorylase
MKEQPLSADSTIFDAIQAIESSVRRFTVVVGGDFKLLGSLSDGDIRRHLISGGKLDDLAQKAMNKRPVTVPQHLNLAEIEKFMELKNVVVVPVVNDNGTYLDMIHTIDLHPESESSFGALETFAFAVIMAGGEGRRLRPLTNGIPKPMITIGDLPLLEHQIRRLAALGIRKVYIAINYLGEIIEEFFKDGKTFGIQIEYLKENEKKGTAGSLTLLGDLPDEPILLINGDIYTTTNFNELYEYHKHSNSVITIGAIDFRIDIPFGVIDTHDDVVAGITEKPSQRFLCNAGVYALSPSALSLIPENLPFNMPDLIQTSLDAGLAIGAFPIYEYWADIGTPEDLEKVRKKYSEMNLMNVNKKGGSA